MFLESEHYVIGYGSLMSHDSRSRFSGIDCRPIPVQLSGWRRAWTTRTLHENQTCLSAKIEEGASFNATLVPIEQISPELAQREQDYEFVGVNSSQLSLLGHGQNNNVMSQLATKQIWVCQNKKNQAADIAYPICQSYVDTCLVGCIETGLMDFTLAFLRTTMGWDRAWINDRPAPRYPRAAVIGPHSLKLIDFALQRADLLQYRADI